MWQNKTQKLKAMAEAKKKSRNYSRLHIHFKRIAATIQIPSLNTSEASEKSDKSETPDAPADPAAKAPEAAPLPKIDVRAILNDLNTEGVGLYSQEALDPGQEIILTFEKPHFLEVWARVKWCQSYNANSHIITAQPFSYRIGVEFLIKKEEDADAIQNFCEDMTLTYLGPPTE